MALVAVGSLLSGPLQALTTRASNVAVRSSWNLAGGLIAGLSFSADRSWQ
jgi:hypothetical protein